MEIDDMAKMAKIIKAFSEENEDSSVEERVIKAAIPYVDPKYKRSAEIILKYAELDRKVKKYKSMSVAAQSENEFNWRRDLLLSLRPQLEQKKQYKIDMLVKLMDLKEIMEKI